eukprot:15441906-Alexandrium_andersonii.AAC.1
MGGGRERSRSASSLESPQVAASDRNADRERRSRLAPRRPPWPRPRGAALATAKGRSGATLS